VWLEADQIIRDGTGGKKGLDDFAKAFFGVRDGDWGVLTYEFDDVVKTLNGVYPHDWASFLKTRLQTPGQPVPLGGIERGGYKLEFKDEPNPYDKARMADGKYLSLFNSLGVTLDKDGKVTASRWDGPAFKAGLVSGMQVMAVNGDAYDADKLKAAITNAKTGNPGAGRPIELLVKRDDRFVTLPITYADGLRWPWLVRAAPGTAPTGLDKLLAPHAGKAGKGKAATDDRRAGMHLGRLAPPRFLVCSWCCWWAAPGLVVWHPTAARTGRSLVLGFDFAALVFLGSLGLLRVADAARCGRARWTTMPTAWLVLCITTILTVVVMVASPANCPARPMAIRWPKCG
jgi:hypothetical protein